MRVPSALTLLSVAPSCPHELGTALDHARSFAHIFDTTRPIAFHDDCHVTVCKLKQQPLPDDTLTVPSATPLHVVVKTYLKLKMSDTAIRQALSEVQIHSSISHHDHIIPLLAALEDSKHLYLVLERAEDGDLRNYFSKLASCSTSALNPKGKGSGGTRSSICLTSLAALGPSDILDYHPTSPTKFGSSGSMFNANTLASYSVQASDEANGLWSRSYSLERDDASIDQSARDSDLLDFIIRPLLGALMALHAQGIVHRDLKPENLLIHKGRVMIADFGLSTHCQSGYPSSSSSSESSLTESQEIDGRRTSSYPGQAPFSSTPMNASAAGTPLYAAPEVLCTLFENKPVSEALGPKNDVWALGVMVLEAVLGVHPMTRLPNSSSHDPPSTSHYSHAYSGGQANMLDSIAYLRKVPLPESTNGPLKAFLTQALQTDPNQRPHARDLLTMLNKWK